MGRLGARPSKIVEEPSAERSQRIVVPEMHPSLLPLPGTHRGPRLMDVARQSARLNRDVVEICEENLHNRLWLLLGNLRRLGGRLLCSFAGCAAHWSHHIQHHYLASLPPSPHCLLL